MAARSLAVRIIKKEGCLHCASYLQRLGKIQGFSFEILDTSEPSMQKQFDEWKIDEVPVVQIIDADTKEVLKQLSPGTFSVKFIQAAMKGLL